MSEALADGTVRGLNRATLARVAMALAVLGLSAVAVVAGAEGGSLAWAMLVAALAGAAAYLLARDRVDGALAHAVLIAAMAGLLAWAVDPALRVWQAPPTWAEALAFSPIGGGLALALLLGGNLASALLRGRPLGWREATALFLLPFLFTSLFLLSSAHLLADLGRAVGIGRWFGWYGEATFGRAVLLFVFNEIAIVGGGWLLDGRWTRSWRLRGLLLASAVSRQPDAADREPRLRRRGRGTAAASASGRPAAGDRRRTRRFVGADLPSHRRHARRDLRPPPRLLRQRAPLARGGGQGRHLQLRLHGAGPVHGFAAGTPALGADQRGTGADRGARRHAALSFGPHHHRKLRRIRALFCASAGQRPRDNRLRSGFRYRLRDRR